MIIKDQTGKQYDQVPLLRIGTRFLRTIVGEEEILWFDTEHKLTHKELLREISLEKKDVRDAGLLIRRYIEYNSIVDGMSTTIDMGEDIEERAITNQKLKEIEGDLDAA